MISRRPTPLTIKKIQVLAHYRDRYLKQRGRAPAWKQARKSIWINDRTVLEHAPELYEKWNDKDFHRQ